MGTRQPVVQFQGHVPDAIRKFIAHEIGQLGNSDSGGLINRLKQLDDEFAAIEKNTPEIAADLTLEKDPLAYVQHIRQQKNDIERQIEGYVRLATSPSMREVYAHLLVNFPDPHDWYHFLRSAVQADRDYTLVRERIGAARTIQDRVVTIASELRVLLRRHGMLHSAGLGNPALLQHLPGLAWLNAPGWEEIWHDDTDYARFWRFSSSPDARSDIEPAAMDEVLRRLIDVALCHEVAPDSTSVSAAVSSQKPNPKTEYIRAFWALLRNSSRFFFFKPTKLYKPVAQTASVILEPIESYVSNDDVRKAVGSNVPRMTREDQAPRRGDKSSKIDAKRRARQS